MCYWLLSWRLPACLHRCGYHLAPVEGGARPLPVTIRRSHVLEDASAQACLACCPWPRWRHVGAAPPCSVCAIVANQAAVLTAQCLLLFACLPAASPAGRCCQVPPQHNLHKLAGPAGGRDRHGGADERVFGECGGCWVRPQPRPVQRHARWLRLPQPPGRWALGGGAGYLLRSRGVGQIMLAGCVCLCPTRHQPAGLLLPHRAAAERLDGGLAALETLGLVLGRALYEGVLLDLPLAPFFVSRLQVRLAVCGGCLPARLPACPPAHCPACVCFLATLFPPCRAGGRCLMSCKRWTPRFTAPSCSSSGTRGQYRTSASTSPVGAARLLGGRAGGHAGGGGSVRACFGGMLFCVACHI